MIPTNQLEELRTLKLEFQRVAKRLIKTDIPDSKETIYKNRDLLISIYNSHVDVSKTIWNNLNNDDKTLVLSQFSYIREKTIKAFHIINCPYIVPTNNLEKIIEEIINPQETEEKYKISNTMATNSSELSPSEFLKLASSIIKPFCGEPNNLQAFLNSVELVATLTTPNSSNLLFQFVKTRLEGKALECIPSNAATLDDIKTSLKVKIKPESSEVVESRLLALRTDRKNLQDFTAEAEELAEKLKRSLIMEGVTDTKAEDMVTKKMVETCRKSARSDLVKSVLASGNFNSHKEVLAKFVVEIADELKDRQVLAYRIQQRHRGRFSRHSYHQSSFNNSAQQPRQTFTRQLPNNSNYTQNRAFNSNHYTNTNRNHFRNPNRGNNQNARSNTRHLRPINISEN